ncbi:MAG: S41 family peptidase [Melioribacteraceae bacterium]|nr:S41 family peptidase [Melioribacteraceae bacterium]
MSRKSYKYLLLPLILVLFSGFIKSDSDFYFKLSKSIDVFGRVYKEIMLNYVDNIDPEKFMQAGIEGMLSSLDPYTNYIDENHQKDIDVITRGKYGGIGASIGLRDESVTIIDLIEGYSAQRQGLRVGDIIVGIDSVKLNSENYNELSAFVKGDPGTTVTLTIKREGVIDNLIFNLVREEIELKNLTYYGFEPENSNNAYLKLSGFSRTAGEEVRKALKELAMQKSIESVVFDLRGNPGGLLDAAINICEKFLKKGDLIVSVIGRDTTEVKHSYSNEEPIAGNTKLAILVDNGSASASEIVAGAIQDHDRGIVVGRKSFGKGLVQTVIPLSFNTSLKITTAKYYTPSGRCIQKIDYSNKESIFNKKYTKEDSTFTTENSRVVYSGGGIVPDTLVSNLPESNQILDLLAKGMFFQFASYYFNTHENLVLDEINKDKLFIEFMTYLESQEFEYRSESEKLVLQLKTAIKKEGYNGHLTSDIENLLERFNKVKTEELNNNKDVIIASIVKEVASRIDGKKGRIKESLKYDKQFKIALELLNNNQAYNKMLSIVSE